MSSETCKKYRRVGSATISKNWILHCAQSCTMHCGLKLHSSVIGGWSLRAYFVFEQMAGTCCNKLEKLLHCRSFCSVVGLCGEVAACNPRVEHIIVLQRELVDTFPWTVLLVHQYIKLHQRSMKRFPIEQFWSIYWSMNKSALSKMQLPGERGSWPEGQQYVKNIFDWVVRGGAIVCCFVLSIGFPNLFNVHVTCSGSTWQCIASWQSICTLLSSLGTRPSWTQVEVTGHLEPST